MVEVSEEEIARGIYSAHRTFACCRRCRGRGRGRTASWKDRLKADETVCAVLCGGNIDANLLARVLEQVFVKQVRYVIFKLLVLDRPGSLANILRVVAEQGANVIEVFHRRAMWLAPLGRVGIEVLLEVRDNEHGREVKKFLEAEGYHVEREGQGDWEA